MFVLEDQIPQLLLALLLLTVLIFLIARHCINRYNYILDRFIEFSNNIMVVTDEEEILLVNSAGLNFFDFRTLEEFKQEHKHIDKLFEEVVDRVTDKKHVGGKKWVVSVVEDEIMDIMVKMQQADSRGDSSVTDQYFSLRVSYMKNKRYLLTFNNITGLMREKVDIKSQAEHDSLTGLYNRLKFNDSFEEIYGRGQHFNEVFSIILFDIDHFKKINDEKGHAVGDSVLRELARLVQLQMRKNDTLARWGGEEFIILSKLTTDIQAKRFAERLRKEIASYKFNHMDYPVTCSFGVTQFSNDLTQSEMFERVDQALYLAKERGRNRVEMK